MWFDISGKNIFTGYWHSWHIFRLFTNFWKHLHGFSHQLRYLKCFSSFVAGDIHAESLHTTSKCSWGLKFCLSLLLDFFCKDFHGNYKIKKHLFLKIIILHLIGNKEQQKTKWMNVTNKCYLCVSMCVPEPEKDYSFVPESSGVQKRLQHINEGRCCTGWQVLSSRWQFELSHSSKHSYCCKHSLKHQICITPRLKIVPN